MRIPSLWLPQTPAALCVAVSGQQSCQFRSPLFASVHHNMLLRRANTAQRGVLGSTQIYILRRTRPLEMCVELCETGWATQAVRQGGGGENGRFRQQSGAGEPSARSVQPAGG